MYSIFHNQILKTNIYETIITNHGFALPYGYSIGTTHQLLQPDEAYFRLDRQKQGQYRPAQRVWRTAKPRGKL